MQKFILALLIIFPTLGFALPAFSQDVLVEAEIEADAKTPVICCVCTPENDPDEKTCVIGKADSCAKLSQLTDKLKKAKCETSILKSEECRAKSETGGMCPNGPVIAEAFPEEKKIAVTPVKPFAPELMVKIPGLTFSKNLTEKDGKLVIPFLAQYISAAYRYLTGLSAIAAAIMIVYGGFLYIVSATGSNASRGKTIIKDAVLGLILVLGAYLILNTINPKTLSLDSLDIPMVKPDPVSFMGGRFEAKANLSEVGLEPVAFEGETKLTIPSDCPGRSTSFKGEGDAEFVKIPGAKNKPTKDYAICYKGKCLDQRVIDYYMAEQRKSGVPAGVIIAQIVTEAGNAAVFNVVDGGKSTIFWNYGGIGCTQREVPQGSCAHAAWSPQATEVGTNKPHPLPCTAWNESKELDKVACVKLCEEGSRDTYTSCGNNCFPLKSHASKMDNGVEVWIPSVQCSKKFNSPEEFLKSHLGFVKPCLPYRDSVYKFAYCIGASTYAGVTGSKAIVLAEIIERNCLCDPANDSLGCKRNLELEQNLAKNMIKKRNLYDRRFYKNGKLDEEAITTALLESTQGLLKVGEKLPQNDIVIPPSE